ncbi:MAG: carboxylate--amine ligase [Negativicutes bacterium]|nr:carboxylate--amine ligase [Negativicutes bacterium]
MNFVFVSPHFPANQFNLCVALRKKGVNVLGIADTDFQQLRPELQWALTDYYKVPDMENYGDMLRAAGFFTHRHGKIDRVESNNEYWLETDARLRTDFNVFGMKVAELNSMVTKSAMKARFVADGIPVARGRVVHTIEEAQELIAETGYPVVAKPDRGMGASDTYKIHNNDELYAFFRNKPAVDYIMEEFISGSILTFDGLADRDCNPEFYSSSQYGEGVMESVLANNHVFYYLNRQVPEELLGYGRRMLKSFGVRERFFHFEFFRRHDDGRIIALEVNLRAPGGFTMDMFNYANDFDVYEQYANVVCGQPLSQQPSYNYFVAHVGRKQSKPYFHSHDEIMAKYAPLIVSYQRLDPVIARAMGDDVYLVRTPDFDELKEVVNFILWLH